MHAGSYARKAWYIPALDVAASTIQPSGTLIEKSAQLYDSSSSPDAMGVMTNSSVCCVFPP